ncbi:MAG TPA: hypothetical protein VHL78_07435 [Actinomycetota bacterium]|nr:hypothetical protein [Actinomycetota bacterium]
MSRPVDAAATRAPVRVGIWGLFDVEDFGAAAILRVLRHELARRIPGLELRTFSPLGYDHATRWDGGEPSEPFGPWSPERVGELAEALDAVVVAGEVVVDDAGLAPAYGLPPEDLVARAPSRFLVEGLGPELEADCPVAYFAAGLPDPGPHAPRLAAALSPRSIVSVGDEAARDRLAAAGVAAPVEVVPHPAALLPAAIRPDVLDRRLEYLRAMGWYPRGEAVVVVGPAGRVDAAPAVAEGLAPLLADRPGAVVVCAGLAPGDDAFADALARALGDRAHRPGALTLEDVAAALQGSAGVVTSSVAVAAAAAGFERPAILLDLDADPRLEEAAHAADAVVRSARDVAAALEKVAAAGSAGEVAAGLAAPLHAELDRLAAMAVDAGASRGAARGSVAPDADLEELRRRLAALASAHRTRGRLLVAQRWRFADRVRDSEARERRTRDELERRIADLEGERARLEAEVAGKDRELATLLDTRTFRYTAGLRRLWGRLRGAGRR